MSNLEFDPIAMGIEPISASETPFTHSSTYYGRKTIDRGAYSVDVPDPNHLIILCEDRADYTLEELDQSAARMRELFGLTRETKEQI